MNRKALTLAGRVVTVNPTHVQARHSLAVIYQKLSDMQAWTGDISGAVATEMDQWVADNPPTKTLVVLERALAARGWAERVPAR